MMGREDAPAGADRARAMAAVRTTRCIENLRTRLLYISVPAVYKSAHAPNIPCPRDPPRPDLRPSRCAGTGYGGAGDGSARPRFRDVPDAGPAAFPSEAGGPRPLARLPPPRRPAAPPGACAGRHDV